VSASSPEAFESLVRDALDSLPGWLAPYLARISVQIDERPPPGEGDVYAFTLFRRPLVDDFGHDPAVLRHEVQITVAHELAHLFGFDEERLDELGYG
jgi:predicted Zn-dependent protease with MMP-like domain